mmetsp:Transcript_26526/g.29623  ORF Transcript_26526/g.29623 Transcript_26526/m.29623 type:complete len:176 (-) Transcript_26526:362-889(-)
MDKYRLVRDDGDDDVSAIQQKSQLQLEIQKDSAATATATATATMTNCEVRITQQGKPRNYISYAMKLFADKSDKIVLKAMGRAINKAVTIAEILKRKMPLHQCNVLSSVEMVDTFEPIEEGLDTVTSRRYVSCIQITLSKTIDGIDDVNDIGYQPPLPIEEMNPGDLHPALIPSS